jgi:riboflavin kinase/FMN adenylyltransferase
MNNVFEDMTVLPRAARGSVLAIGNFDGVHPGHQALITRAREVAAARKTRTAAMTFEPHPREFFKPNDPPFRLTLLPMKARLFAALGVDDVFAPPFDAGFAAQSADHFMAFLRDRLEPESIVIGADFAFGKGRGGGIDTLRDMFDVNVVKPVTCPDGAVYSSSRIRDLLQGGKLQEAAGLLGRAWEIEAEVVHGDKRGRELGYPTANQQVDRYIRIPYGIYAVRALIEGETQPRIGVANFGIRPMFKIKQPIFETHIFDFMADIYGKTMRVEPVKFLRPEKAFSDLEALVRQMKQDCLDARAVFK